MAEITTGWMGVGHLPPGRGSGGGWNSSHVCEASQSGSGARRHQKKLRLVFFNLNAVADVADVTGRLTEPFVPPSVFRESSYYLAEYRICLSIYIISKALD